MRGHRSVRVFTRLGSTLLTATILASAARAVPQLEREVQLPFVSIEGVQRMWQPVTLTFAGKESMAETIHAPGQNPFLDYRLTVTFSHPVSAAEVRVPGYYAADGDAADTSAGSGNRWRVRFTPDRSGTWLWKASFRTAPGIAVNRSLAGSVADARIHGAFGKFIVRPADPAAPGLLGQGMLQYVDESYFRFAESQEYFLKSGAGGPENFLGYYEFDNTVGWSGNPCLPGPSYLHHYAPHAGDYTGDAVDQAHLWGESRGQNILGAINYMASVGVNSLYFITNGYQGDGQDVWPWEVPEDKLHYDVSKLDQWERVFAHMTQRGLQLQFVFEENENDQTSLAQGGLGYGLTPERKLYYREMIARFAHHPAVIWVIGDESNYFADVPTMESLASEIRALDPYRHPIAFHSKHPCSGPGCAIPYPTIIGQYAPYFGFDAFEATAYQTAPGAYNTSTVQLRQSQFGLRPWAHYGDEQSLNAIPTNLVINRTKALWGNLMGGGAGVAWYPGNNSSQYPPGVNFCDYFDITLEDFRKFEDYFLHTRRAVDLFQAQLPFTEMFSYNALAAPDAAEDYVFVRAENSPLDIKAIYAVYRGTGSACTLTIGNGTHDVEWFNPRTGAGPLTAPALVGPGSVALPPPEEDPGQDWLAIVRQL